MGKRGWRALLTLDVAFLSGMGFIGLAFLCDTFRLNQTAARLPRATAILMIGLIIFVLYGKVRDARQALPVEEKKAEVPLGPVTGRVLPWWAAWLVIASYPVMLVTVGFGIATFVFLAGVAILLGTRPVPGVVFGLVGAAAMIGLFIYVLQVPMPDSWIGDLTLALQGY
jgi:hypothetical protein